MRSISGQVVEQNPDAFKVITPYTTVGIRGTDYILKLGHDGSLTLALVQVDTGHNVVLTSHQGSQLALNLALQGAFIPADDLGMIIPRNFTTQEVESLIREFGILTGNDENLDEEEKQAVKKKSLVKIQIPL